MKKLWTMAALLLLATALMAQSLPVLKKKGYAGSSFYGYATDRIVVTFDRQVVKNFRLSDLRKGLTGVAEIDALATDLKTKKIVRQFPAFDPRRSKGPHDLSLFYKVYFQEAIDALAVVKKYKELASVLDAQPVGIHYLTATPNDPQYVDQWHFYTAGDHDIDGPEAWDIETGDPSIIVALMDSGVRFYHKDLGGSNASSTNKTATDGNVWINTAEKNGTPGVDDDGNGFVDDWVGYDFVASSTFPASGEDGDTPDNDPSDFNGHGTHCAGNVGALNNNGYGVCATTGGWGDGTLQPTGNGVKVMCLRIGYDTVIHVGLVNMDAAAEAFQYAADNGAKIASCSWGSSDTGGLGAAVDNFVAAGGLVFHAAGNDNADSPDYLDNRGDCISVASTDSNDAKSDFSNYGTWVDISAPGTDILSLVENPDDEANDYVAVMSGTSMATPIAASVAALIWSKHPTWSAAQVKQRLYDTADNIDATIGSAYVGKMGAGRVNAHEAVFEGPISVTLTSFEAIPVEKNRVLLSWSTASEADVAGFYIQRKLNAHDTFKRINESLISSKGDLANGANYEYIDEVDISGSIGYRLEEISTDGNSIFYDPVFLSTLSEAKDRIESPFRFKLQQNFPNPFNPETRIAYEIAKPGQVTLDVFDVTGRMVRRLVDGVILEGSYEATWDGRDAMGQSVASGVYLYRLTAPDFTSTRKMLLSR